MVRVRRDVGSTIFLLLTLESIFGGFYVVVTRSVTPIFLVAYGYVLRNLLLLNVLAGLLSLAVAFSIYKLGGLGKVKWRLVLALGFERVAWFLIPWSIFGGPLTTALNYAVAIAATIPSNVLMYAVMFTSFEEYSFRRIMAYRTIGGSVASVVGQLTVVSVLATGTGLSKYVSLYILAFIVSMASLVLVSLAPISDSKFSALRKGKEGAPEEIEVMAGNTYLLLVILLSATNLISISWVPWLMRYLNAPDYLVATLGLTQTIVGIVFSTFWARRSLRQYRYAIMMLSFVPLLIALIRYPLAHIGIAALYSFSMVGANLYASIVFAKSVERLGVIKASTLLSSANALAMTLSGLLGYVLAPIPQIVFVAAASLCVGGLILALVAIPELAIVPPYYVRLYSRTLYNSSVASYNFLIFTMSETAKAALRITALVIAVILLFVVYRTLYYIIVLTGG